jgi:plasmid stabilization system protein ParE
MKYNVHITGTADTDLNSAVDYIDHILLNPQAADELLIEAEEAIADLATFPEKYALVEDPVLNAWGVRFVSVNNYLAFYVISEEEKRVNIVRFLHSKQNWISILKNSTLFSK